MIQGCQSKVTLQVELGFMVSSVRSPKIDTALWAKAVPSNITVADINVLLQCFQTMQITHLTLVLFSLKIRKSYFIHLNYGLP